MLRWRPSSSEWRWLGVAGNSLRLGSDLSGESPRRVAPSQLEATPGLISGKHAPAPQHKAVYPPLPTSTIRAGRVLGPAAMFARIAAAPQ